MVLTKSQLELLIDDDYSCSVVKIAEELCLKNQ